MTTQRTDITLTDEQKNILDLEEKYFDIIKNIFQSQEFIIDLEEIEKNIKKDYDYLSNYWQIKNKVKTPLERLLRYHIYKNMGATGTYYSPLSSDIAFYKEDALINIDAKTTDLDGNEGDDTRISFDRNQISFRNKIKNKNDPFEGVHYDPNLPSIEKGRGLPVLTYFLRITYTDNFSEFDINHITLDCVPNGKLSELFDYDLISNFKTYSYLTKTYAETLGRNDLTPKKTEEKHWEPFKMGSGNYFYDDQVKNPFYPTENVLWGKIDGDYKVMTSGNSARIDPNDTINRFNSLNKEWIGHTRWNVNINDIN